MSNPPDVKIVVPAECYARNGLGTKVFINGIEFESLKRIAYSSQIETDDIVVSKIELTFFGDIAVERSGA